MLITLRIKVRDVFSLCFFLGQFFIKFDLKSFLRNPMEAFGYVYTLMDSFFAGLKTIPHRASIHTEEQ